MAKQRGGSPFTDSWFEMPFWILFFLFIISGILLWHFGVFSKPVAIAQPVKSILPGVSQQGVLTIVEAIQSQDGLSAEVTYFTKNTPQGAKVMMRLIHTGNDGAFVEFPISEKHKTVTVKTRIGNLQLKHSLEAYLSLNDTPLTPVQTVPTQPDAQKSSGSFTPSTGQASGKYAPSSTGQASGSFVPGSSPLPSGPFVPSLTLADARYDSTNQEAVVSYSMKFTGSPDPGSTLQTWFQVFVGQDRISDDIAMIPTSLSDMTGGPKTTYLDMFSSKTYPKGTKYTVKSQIHLLQVGHSVTQPVGNPAQIDFVF